MRTSNRRSSRAKANSKLDLRQAVIYARVSSREQEEEGWSIDAQLRLLRDYAAHQGTAVVAEFVEAQSAKVAGRRAFGEMLAFMGENPGIDILVEKTDRLYRNIRDWVTIEDLGVTLHFVREGQVIGPDSRSSDKLIHGFKVLMARNYVDNLSEEIRKGMNEKALQGVYPSHAPLGYLNVVGSDGRRKVILPDPVRAPLVRQLFDELEKGLMSIKQLHKLAGQIGLRTKKGNRVTRASIHQILTNPVYCGLIRWKEDTLQGIHEPLISPHQFERCQQILNGRFGRRGGYGEIPFAYRGLIRCTCGQLMTGEIKKGRYVYYHCNGPKDVCGRPFVREELLTEAFRQMLAQMTPPPMMADWLRRAVILGHECRMDFQKGEEERLEAEIVTTRQKLERLYLDKVAGELSTETYKDLRAKFEVELRDLQATLSSFHRANDRTADESLATLELALGAQNRFNEAEDGERHAMLKTLLSNCVWEAGELCPELRSPYGLMLKASQNTPEEEPTFDREDGKNGIWWR